MRTIEEMQYAVEQVMEHLPFDIVREAHHSLRDLVGLASRAERAEADIARARAALGEAWLKGGVSLAAAIRHKTTALERLADDEEGDDQARSPGTGRRPAGASS